MSDEVIDVHAELDGSYDPYDCDLTITSIDWLQGVCARIEEVQGAEYADEYRRQLAELFTRRRPAGGPGRGPVLGRRLRAVDRRR
jgi:hypothetical protein